MSKYGSPGPSHACHCIDASEICNLFCHSGGCCLLLCPESGPSFTSRVQEALVLLSLLVFSTIKETAKVPSKKTICRRLPLVLSLLPPHPLQCLLLCHKFSETLISSSGSSLTSQTSSCLNTRAGLPVLASCISIMKVCMPISRV